MGEFFSVVGIVTLALGASASWNIMLIAVKERAREIGVRKALGATTRSIQQQFFMEGFFLTLASGGAGMLLALGLCKLVNMLPMPARFEGMVLSWPAALFIARHPAAHRHHHLHLSGDGRRNCRQSTPSLRDVTMRVSERRHTRSDAVTAAGTPASRSSHPRRCSRRGLNADRHRAVSPLVPYRAVDARHLVGHRVGGRVAGVWRGLPQCARGREGAFSDGVAVTMMGRPANRLAASEPASVCVPLADVEAISHCRSSAPSVEFMKDFPVV